MKKFFTLFAAFVWLLPLISTAQCSGGRYHDLVFPGTPTVISNINYGHNLDQNGVDQQLYLDIYQPACDATTNRGLVVFAHGGSFMTGDKADAGYVATAQSLARLGYVVATINYRLGFPTSGLAAQYGFNSAIMRGLHDSRAAIRFLRNNALNGGNTYGVDPNKIFFGGVSAGGIIALHLAYQNTAGEMNLSCGGQPGTDYNSIEGNSNTLNVSSKPRAIISISGGIRDLNWITSYDTAVCMAHGTIDGTVPYGSGTFGGFFTVHGSSSIATCCNTTNTPYCFKPMWNQDHTPSNVYYVDTMYVQMRNFLEHFMCGTTLGNCTYNGTPTATAVTASIAITSGTNPTCSGVPVTFTATPTGGSPSYVWKKGSTTVGTNNSTFTSSSLINGDVITCVITTCLGTATSNALTMVVNAVSAPAVAIVVTSGNDTTCAGQAVGFTATPTNGGHSPIYQWKKGGSNVGSNSSSYTLAAPANNDVITCVMNSSSTCASPTSATSNAITVRISASLAPAVSIAVTSGNDTTCAGQAVGFTATPANGGTVPSYQWKLGGNNVGTNSLTYTLSSPANGNLVSCVMTSNSSCASPTTATSNSITITVSTSVAPTVSIAVTSGNDTTCTGVPVGFTATPTNGGTAPSYQWKLGGNNVGTNSPTYTLSSPANGNVVSCVMTSNSSCASPTTATSFSLAVTVIPLPTISKIGNVLTSSANTGNHWYLNGNVIGGAINKTHTAASSGNYTVKAGNCTSQALAVTITDIEDLSDAEHFFTVYPNPNDGNFTLSFTAAVKTNYKLEIKNVTGALVFKETLTDFSGAYSKQFDIAEKYGSGLYIISLHSSKTEIMKKILVH